MIPSGRAMTTRIGVFTVWISVVGLVSTAAHEIGTTQVTIQLNDASRPGHGRYRIVVDAAAETLLERLSAATGVPEPSGGEADLATRLSALADPFREGIDVVFDGTRVRPDVQVTVTPPASDFGSATAELVLTGDVPAGAAHLVWRYRWTSGSYALVVTGPHGAPASTEWLEGSDSSRSYSLGIDRPSASRWSTVPQYLVVGVSHILPHGLDHMLFVLSLFLMSTGLRSLLWQVSAFTLAHTITLGLGMYGLLSAPATVVEALIAMSIVWAAVENLASTEVRPRRIALVFGFGLLHGLGFASALSTLGLPPTEFLIALVSFNVGVEAGQLLVIAGAFAVVGWFRNHQEYRARVVLPASVAIAGVAIYWTVERTALVAW